MHYTNQQIAEMFEKIAKLMEFRGSKSNTDQFRIRAYQNASQSVKDFPHNIHTLYEAGNLEEIPGLGKDTFNKVIEFIESGTMKKYEELKKEVPENVLELFEVPGIGPKQTKLFYQELGIETIDQLENIINNNPEKITQLPRMGKQKLNQIMQGIEIYRAGKERIPLGVIYPYAQEFKKQIQDFEEVKQVEIAGSIRRMKETIGDMDILVDSKDIKKTMEKATNLDNVDKIIAFGENKTSIFLKTPSIQVDIKAFDESSLGAAIQYFTGSKEHNVKLRTIAKQKGYKISEYGIFYGEEKVGGKKEEDIYKTLGLEWIPPEMRYDTGEIEAAQKNNLPELISYNDLKGDLHNHSNRSDGSSTLEEMIEEAINIGYEYIAITDHSKSLGVAGGLDEEKFNQRLEEINTLKEKYKDKIQILVGTECDILASGELDYSKKILEKCDIVVASIHMGYKGDMTDRYLKALDNHYVNIIGHPTTRMIGERNEIEANWDKIFKKAIEKNIAMEVNCQPLRLDLKDTYIRHFLSLGGKIAINTDSHNKNTLSKLSIYGIGQARRGWAESTNVINTRSFNDLKKFLNKQGIL